MCGYLRLQIIPYKDIIREHGNHAQKSLRTFRISSALAGTPQAGERVRRLPGRQGIYLIVSPEHRERGAPPVDSWLGAYFRLRGQPYYLGLLSAAAKHGSSRQAVQIIQVITEQPMRPMKLGRARLEFHVKTGLSHTPLAEFHGLRAHLAISSAAATAPDLTTFSQSAGGMSRVADVIAGMLPAIAATDLRHALAAEPRVTAKQRLGYLLDTLGAKTLATIVHKMLPRRTTRILLESSSQDTALHLSTRWNVVDNVGLEGQRT